jgi:hypothetical protein
MIRTDMTSFLVRNVIKGDGEIHYNADLGFPDYKLPLLNVVEDMNL